KLQPPTGVAARFDDDSFRVGRINLSRTRQVVALFNGEDAPQNLSFQVAPRTRITDFWDGTHVGEPNIELSPRSARLLICDK
ncbi:MAG TPA: hypothetical protein VFT08_00750, partial [Pyrinomonadaceae bacterium]|nr:hypothetical protein [Pyrinomonadaceae bacterium]